MPCAGAGGGVGAEAGFAAGGGELVLGSKVQPFKAVEISDQEKIPILRAYLKRWKVEVGVFFQGVDADSPEEELKRIGPDHPVFRIEPAG